MTALKIYVQIKPDTNTDALDGWIRGLPGLQQASFVREMSLELKDTADLSEVRRALASCPFAYIVDHTVLEDTVAVTEEGLAAMAGTEPDDTEIIPHEPQVVGHNADDILLGWAEALNGREYREELTDEEASEMADAGIILVHGGSDDLIYFAGAFAEEMGAGDTSYYHWNGEEFFANYTETKTGAPIEPEEGASVVIARWCPDEKKHLSWAYETDAPRYATFEVMEDADCYGEGLLVYVNDLLPKAEVEAPAEEETTDATEDADDSEAGNEPAKSGNTPQADTDSNEAEDDQQIDVTSVNFASDEAGEAAMKFIKDKKLTIDDVLSMKGTGKKDNAVTVKDVKALVAKLEQK